MKLAPVIARVKALQSGFRSVEGATNFAEALEHLKAYPSAFVLPIRETAAPNRLGANRTRQKVTVTFGIIMAIRNVSAGGGADVELEDLRDPVVRGLVGWKHPDMCSQTEFAGGGLVTVTDGAVWWQDNFTADEQITGGQYA